MTDYIHQTDNVIDVAPGPLPASWRNVSGLELLSDEDLKVAGWLPVVDDAPSFDPDLQYLVHVLGAMVGDDVPVGADSVTRYYEVRNRPAESALPSILKRRSLSEREEILASLGDAFTAEQVVLLKKIINLTEG
jgi:hypothetical protein